MGVQTILLKDDEVGQLFSMFKMGYRIFSNCAKLSSALVLMIKNDCSQAFLKWELVSGSSCSLMALSLAKSGLMMFLLCYNA